MWLIIDLRLCYQLPLRWTIYDTYWEGIQRSYSQVAVYPRTADILVKQSVGMHNPNRNSFFTMLSLGVPECIFAQCKLQ